MLLYKKVFANLEGSVFSAGGFISIKHDINLLRIRRAHLHAGIISCLREFHKKITKMPEPYRIYLIKFRRCFWMVENDLNAAGPGSPPPDSCRYFSTRFAFSRSSAS